MHSDQVIASQNVVRSTLPRLSLKSQRKLEVSNPVYIPSSRYGLWDNSPNSCRQYGQCHVCEDIENQFGLYSYDKYNKSCSELAQTHEEWCKECNRDNVGPPCKCHMGGKKFYSPYSCSWDQYPNNNPLIDDSYQAYRYTNRDVVRSSSEWALIATNHIYNTRLTGKVHSQDIRNAQITDGIESLSAVKIPPLPIHLRIYKQQTPRLSRSLENLPCDIKDHILKCRCSCNHLGYGNLSMTVADESSHAAKSTKSCIVSKAELRPETKEVSTGQKPLDIDMKIHGWSVLCLMLILACIAGVGVSLPLALQGDQLQDYGERITAAKILLSGTPLVDGHNDLPWNIRKFMHNKLHSFNFTANLSDLRPWSKSTFSHTDLPRLREGQVAAQFWVSYVPCESQYLNAVQLTIEQIDLIKRMIAEYPNDLNLATSAADVETSFREGRIASLIGVEGGHAIQNSLGVLRSFYDLGIRYMTLTHACSTPWAESARNNESDSEDPNAPRGLTRFGKVVVREMNRLGLLVDLSHVAQATMRAAMDVSRAPVLFSHSSAYAICQNPRNVPDDILRRLSTNGGLVMISFYNRFLTCSQKANIDDVINHINYVRLIAGIDHVGIGADFDGVNQLPSGLEDVSKYPALFAELMKDPSWTDNDLRKLAGLNLLRVLKEVERVKEEVRLRKRRPYEAEVPVEALIGKQNCSFSIVHSNPS